MWLPENQMTSRVLITGGSGFLGRALIKHLKINSQDDIYTLSRSEGDNKHFQCSLLDEWKLKECLNICQPDVVYHLAACPLVRPDEKNPNQILQDNIIGTFNLIHNLKFCPRVVFSSSITVYGDFSKGKPPNWTTRENPISVYAATKLACENIINVYTSQGKIDGTSIRIPALVGLNSTHGLIHDLIRKLTSTSEFLELFGDEPGTEKPFCCVDEIAQIFHLCAVKHYDYGRLFLAGTTTTATVEQAAVAVMRGLGIYKRIKWLGKQSVWLGDNPLVCMTPDVSCKISSYDAIYKTAEEFRKL